MKHFDYRLSLLALLIVAFVLGGLPGFCQTTGSTITGRVVDPSGAVIPGAQITAVHDESGVRVVAETNEVGLYRVPGLPPGPYRIEATAAGFQRLARTGVVLQVAQVLQLDLALELGTPTESVEVTGAVPLLESQTSTVGQIVERSMIENMPLPDRSALGMVKLTPGAVVQSESGSDFSVAGGRTKNSNYSLDGGNWQNLAGLGVPQPAQRLPMDAVQEFRLLTNNYSAEHGHTTSGVLLMSSRSGTNKYHGSLYEWFRNDALDARNFFAARKTPRRQNYFGGSLGGPIVKDKTHFFLSWEQIRLTTGATTIQTVPTTLERSGDFSQTLNATGKMILLFDPETTSGNQRQPFPGNVIPVDHLDPVAKAATSYWPMPNRPGLITGANNFQADFLYERHTRNTGVARLDHQFGPSDRMMFRYLMIDQPRERPGAWPRPEGDPSARKFHHRNQTVFGSYTHIFSTNLINEFRVNLLPDRNYQTEILGLNQDIAGQLGLTGVSSVGFPRMAISGIAPLGGTSHFRKQHPAHDSQYHNALSYYRGKHAVKLGIEYRRVSNQDDIDISSSGSFSFGPLLTGQPGKSKTGIAFASFMLGQADSASIRRPDVILSRAGYWAWYVQDDWRVSDNLTLNVGLRWEADIPRTVDHDRMNAFDTTANNPVSGTPGIVTFAGRAGVPRSAYDADYNNFGPRFGFAYRVLGGKTTVIRGGAGVFYGPTVSNAVVVAAALGFSSDVSLTSPERGIVPAVRLQEGFPAVPEHPELGPGFGAVPVGQKTTTAVTFFERTRPAPISTQYNLNVQHELRENLLVEVGYMANLSHHLTSKRDLTLNQVRPDLMGPGKAQLRRPYPQFSNVRVINPPLGNSSYHGFFIKAERRYSQGLTFLGHYTFSKYIDDAESSSEFGDAQSYMDAYNRALDKGLSGSDIRHRALLSAVYELPFLRNGTTAAARVLGGWKMGVIAEFQFGPPFTVYNRTDTTNAFAAGPLRPNLSGDPGLSDGEKTLGRWFNTGAFAAPAPYTFGNSPRSVLRAPGISNIDLSLMKDFRITERIGTELRGEFFNLLNHANFGLPSGTLGTAAFGSIRSARDARRVQLVIRVTF